jgi:hypothetical protein
MLTPAQALHFLCSKVAAEVAYDPPMGVDGIKKKYPKLLKDPIHRWRAQNGIELVHQEPSDAELNRIWANWQRMSAEQKKISDQKSLELFGVNNADNYKKLFSKVAADSDNKSYAPLASRGEQAAEPSSRAYKELISGLYTQGRGIGAGGDPINPSFLRSFSWPDAKRAPVPPKYNGNAVVERVDGKREQAISLRPAFGFQGPTRVVLTSSPDSPTDQSVLTHELAHLYDPWMAKPNLIFPGSTVRGEAEVPAIVAETAYDLNAGNQPPQWAPGAPWIYDAIRKHGPQVSPGQTDLEREDALRTWMKALRDKNSNLGSKYNDWLKSEAERVKQQQEGTYVKPEHGDIQEVLNKMDRNNPRVKAFLDKLNPEKKSLLSKIPTPLLWGGAIVGAGAAGLLAYWLYKKFTKDDKKEDTDKNDIQMPEGVVAA